MMPLVGRSVRCSGPRGLMPNPKSVRHFDVGKAVREVKAGKVEYRVEKAGIVHVPGSAKRALPTTRWRIMCAPLSARSPAASRAASKAPTSRRSAVSSTMGPGVRVELSGLAEEPRA